MGNYIVKTLGCKANTYDSQWIESELQKKGWTPSQSSVDLCIINSCTVTDEADRRSRKIAAKLARENPGAKVVITGCAAEVAPESFRPGAQQGVGISYVVGNQNKNRLVELVLSKMDQEKNLIPQVTSDILNTIPTLLGTVQSYTEILSKHPTEREWPAATDSFLPFQLQGHSDKTRAFLKIQEGCNSFCTYCIIPYGRGPSRSLRPSEVLKQVADQVQKGAREIVITGTNIGDYGRDWNFNPGLGDLLEMILEKTSIQRLRLSSLDPTETTPQILSLMKNNPRFCPHFHISLQSPHTRILKLMKRKYQFEHVKDCLEKIAEFSGSVGGVFVGMDLITGFPGETEEEFQWSYNTLAALPWTRLHVFPYSERAGTPATRLSHSVAPSVRAERTRKLNQLSMERLTCVYQKVLKHCQSKDLCLDSVLMEKNIENKRQKEKRVPQWRAGYTPNYLRVMIPCSALTQRNQLISAKPIDLMMDSQGHDISLVCQPV